MSPTVEIAGASLSLYGIFSTLGYTFGFGWPWLRREDYKLTNGEFWALIYMILFGVLVGGRLGYYLVEWRFIAANPDFIWGNWRSGWVHWFGVIGGFSMGHVWVVTHGRLYKRRTALPIADYSGPGIALGQGIGRIGCFFEGCCYGCPTLLPWGARYTDPSSSVDDRLLGVPLHPVQLYEAIGLLALFVFLGYVVIPGIRSKRFTPGSAVFGYIVLYAVMRFFLEFLRCDDRGTLLHPVLSPSQWVSLAAAAVIGAYWYRQGLFERNPRGRRWFR